MESIGKFEDVVDADRCRPFDFMRSDPFMKDIVNSPREMGAMRGEHLITLRCVDFFVNSFNCSNNSFVQQVRIDQPLTPGAKKDGLHVFSPWQFKMRSPQRRVAPNQTTVHSVQVQGQPKP